MDKETWQVMAKIISDKAVSKMVYRALFSTKRDSSEAIDKFLGEFEHTNEEETENRIQTSVLYKELHSVIARLYNPSWMNTTIRELLKYIFGRGGLKQFLASRAKEKGAGKEVEDVGKYVLRVLFGEVVQDFNVNGDIDEELSKGVKNHPGDMVVAMYLFLKGFSDKNSQLKYIMQETQGYYNELLLSMMFSGLSDIKFPTNQQIRNFVVDLNDLNTLIVKKETSEKLDEISASISKGRGILYPLQVIFYDPDDAEKVLRKLCAVINPPIKNEMDRYGLLPNRYFRGRW